MQLEAVEAPTPGGSHFFLLSCEGLLLCFFLSHPFVFPETIVEAEDFVGGFLSCCASSVVVFFFLCSCPWFLGPSSTYV